MVLLTALAVCLSRCTGSLDVVIGTPVSNRTRPELQRLVGLVANTIVCTSARMNSSAIRRAAVT